MKQISNKEYERYHKYQIDRLYGRILTPDGLRLICAALDYDPEKIGKHMLEMLAKFRNEGIIESVCAAGFSLYRSGKYCRSIYGPFCMGWDP